MKWLCYSQRYCNTLYTFFYIHKYFITNKTCYIKYNIKNRKHAKQTLFEEKKNHNSIQNGYVREHCYCNTLYILCIYKLYNNKQKTYLLY